MKYAIATTLSIFLIFVIVSCKEQKKQVADTTEPKAPSVQPAKEQLTPEEKRLKEGDKKLGWVMQNIDTPEYKLDKLHKKGEILSENYIKYAGEIIKVAKTIKDIDHPDEKLTGLANEMLDAMAKYEEAFNSKDKEKLKANWPALKKTCSACHKIYRKDTGGY